MEEWEAIVGYEKHYEISNQGRVRSVLRSIRYKNGKTVTYAASPKTTHVNAGRVVVSLSKDGVNTTYQISRLMAFAFLPNPNEWPEVDHIDRNPLNNNLSNLRWADRKLNLENRAPFEYHLGVTGERYITKTAQGHYQVMKMIDGKHVSLGTRDTLEEAIQVREKGVVDIRDRSCDNKTKERYISILHNGTFTVRKTTNGVRFQYGTYKTLEEAIVARNAIPGYVPITPA